MADSTDSLEHEALLPSSKPRILKEKPDNYSTHDNGYSNEQQSDDDTFPLKEISERDISEEQGDSSKQEEYKTYKRRWYILILFSLINAQQSLVWNTWGPIANTAKAVLGWNNANIALLTNWCPIIYVFSAAFFSWLLDVKGLRVSMLLISLLLSLGVAIRCIPVPVENMIWVMNIGQIFIGLPCPVLTGAPPLVSAVWFPPHQRTTSTACLATAAYLGVAFSFLIGPLIVTDLKVETNTSVIQVNESIHNNLSDSLGEHLMMSSSMRSQHLYKINLLMYIEAGFTILLCIFIVIYFPAKPPTPPSSSAETKREDFLKGAKILFTNSQFWLPTLCFGISIGVWTMWSTQLDIIFHSTVNVDQITIGWIGFYSNIIGVFCSIVIALFVDRLGGKMKLVIILITSVGVACVIWSILMTLKVIAFHLASLYVSIIGIAVIINSAYPLYFEITVEGTYPVSEGITAMIMTWLLNVFGVIFLLILMDQQIGVLWMNYAMLGAVVVCLPMLLLYKERYNRLTQDTAVNMLM